MTHVANAVSTGAVAVPDLQTCAPLLSRLQDTLGTCQDDLATTVATMRSRLLASGHTGEEMGWLVAELSGEESQLARASELFARCESLRAEVGRRIATGLLSVATISSEPEVGAAAGEYVDPGEPGQGPANAGAETAEPAQCAADGGEGEAGSCKIKMIAPPQLPSGLNLCPQPPQTGPTSDTCV